MQQLQQIDLEQPKEAQRRSYAAHTIGDMRKQKQTIERLKKQNDHLKGLISGLGDRTNNRPSTANTTRSSRVNTVKELITQEKSELHKLEEQSVALRKRAWTKKTPELGEVVQKQLRILENRLDKGTQKLNEAVAQNKDLRSLIDNLRRQRAVFDSLYNKLEKDLHEKRKQMADIIEKANHSYEQRDRANQHIQNIKEQTRKETFDFERELKQLSMLTEKSRIGNQSTVSKRPQSSQSTVDHPRTSKRKENKVDMKRLEKLRDDFKKIETGTQILNFSELVKIFTQNEQKNFKTFKFLNQQANQIQELQEELQTLNRELDQWNKNETEPDKMLDQATRKIQAAEQKEAEVYAQNKQSSKNMASLMNYVEKMFSCIFTDKAAVEKAVGSNNITETTVMIYLGVIEQRAAKLCRMYKDLLKADTAPEAHLVADLKGQSKKDAFVFDDFEQDDQEYDKILTHDDFLKKASEKLSVEQNDKQRKDQRTKKR